MKWRVLPSDSVVLSRLIGELGITEATALILANRGITDPEVAVGYISDPLRLLHDPFLFAQMERAVERIVRAVKSRERILIFGDYDADGITGSALLYLFLKELGAEVDVFIPHRTEHGYGLTQRSLTAIEELDFSLLITVDCGITAVCETATLVRNGVDVIITDHHTPGALIPSALAVINPRLDRGYPFEGLAGVGVALKLAEGIALYLEGEKLRREVIKKYISLAALGTVADIMEVVDENRFFVKYGLRKMRENLGLRALQERAGLSEERSLALQDISFIIAPRINAPGRMSHAIKAFRLLTTDDESEAEELAGELNRENSKRQREEEKVTEEALSLYQEDDAKVAIVCGDGWHPGVIGIAASRIAKVLKKPCVLVSFNGSSLGRGSGRSYADVDLYSLMSCASDVMEHFGGHKNAVGFSVEREKVGELVRRVKERSRLLQFSEETLDIDGVLSFEHFEASFLRELLQVSPFGEGFPEPVFLFKRVAVRNPKEVGRKTVIFQAIQDRVMVDAVMFDPVEEFTGSGVYDIAASVELSQWRGEKRLRLRCKDVRKLG